MSVQSLPRVTLASAVETVRASFPSLGSFPSLPSFPSLEAGKRRARALPSAPAEGFNLRLLVGLAVCSFLLIAYTAIASGGSVADDIARPAAQSAQAARPSAPADPFAETRLKVELRTLRSKLAAGESARNLSILADGTMGTMVVSGKSIQNVMAQGADVVREPISDWPALVRGPQLDLAHVHAAAPLRILGAAKHLFGLPSAKLTSLKLEADPANKGDFIWTGTWNDAAQTTLYADQEGRTVSMARPN